MRIDESKLWRQQILYHKSPNDQEPLQDVSGACRNKVCRIFILFDSIETEKEFSNCPFSLNLKLEIPDVVVPFSIILDFTIPRTVKGPAYLGPLIHSGPTVLSMIQQ